MKKDFFHSLHFGGFVRIIERYEFLAMNEDYLKKYMGGNYKKSQADKFFNQFSFPGLVFPHQEGDVNSNAIPKFFGKMFEHMNLVREYSKGSSSSRVFREYSATATIMLRIWINTNYEVNNVYVRDVDLNYYKSETD